MKSQGVRLGQAGGSLTIHIGHEVRPSSAMRKAQERPVDLGVAMPGRKHLESDRSPSRARPFRWGKAAWPSKGH